MVGCSSGASPDDLSTYATGATSLRYDSTDNQFVYNWQSPEQPGKCYVVQIGLTDGNTYQALFQLR